MKFLSNALKVGVLLSEYTRVAFICLVIASFCCRVVHFLPELDAMMISRTSYHPNQLKNIIYLFIYCNKKNKKTPTVHTNMFELIWVL